MQKIFTLPPVWDSKKFAARYGLNFIFDYFVTGGDLVVHKGELVTDDPPIFEAPDPPKPPDPTPKELLDKITALEVDVAVLKTKVK